MTKDPLQTRSETVRLDKWLWAARFFKTRGLAAEAINGGKVHVEGARAKPSKHVSPGMRITVRRGETEWHIVVRTLDKQRRPAQQAMQLYEETPESQARRMANAERRKLQQTRHQRGSGRPTKKDRRQIGDITGR